MRVVYVSGKFSDTDEIHGIEENINKASRAALVLWSMGYAVVCPHKNTKDFQHVKHIPYGTWIQGDIEILRRCDAIYMLNGWYESEGAKREYKAAVEAGLEVWFEGGSIPKPE